MQLTIQPNYYSYFAKNQLSKQNSNKQIKDLYSHQIHFRGNNDVFDYNAHLNEKLRKMSWVKRYLFFGIQRAENQTLLEQIDFRDKRCKVREEELNLRESDISQRDEASITRVKACDEDIARRKRTIHDAEEASKRTIAEKEKAVEISAKEAQLRIKKDEQVSLARIALAEATSQNTIKTAEKASRKRIQVTEEASNAKIVQREQDSETRIHAREEELASLEDSINSKVELATKKLTEAKKLRNEGLHQKEVAIDIRGEAIQIKRDAIRLKDEVLGIDIDSIKRSAKSFTSSRSRQAWLREKCEFFDQEVERIKRTKKASSIILKKLEELAKRIKQTGPVCSKKELYRLIEQFIQLGRQIV